VPLEREATAGGFIDLHSHVLPRVDDGAVDLDEAVAMCRRAAADGCVAIVATPHLRHPLWPDLEAGMLRRACDALRQAIDGAIDGALEIFLGGEIAVHSESVAEMFELPAGDLLTLAGSRYLLLELDWRGLGPDPVELVHELVIAGWFPMIAHPERVPWLATDPGLLAALVRHGATLQLTAASVTGELGRNPQVASDRLLDAGLVAFVASDAHGATQRPPGLLAAFQRVRETWGEEVAERLFLTHPRAVLEDRPLAAVPPRDSETRT